MESNVRARNGTRALTVSLIAAALCLGAQAAPAREAPPELVKPPAVARLLPKDALMVAVFENVDATLAALEKTSLHALWAEPEVKAFLGPLMERLTKNVEGFEEEVGEFAFADVRSAFGGQVALSLVNFAAPKAGGEAELELAMLAGVSDGVAAARLVARARRAVVEIGGPEFRVWQFGPWEFGTLALDGTAHEVGYLLSGDAFVLSMGPAGRCLSEIVAAAVGRAAGKSLADDEGFMRSVRQAGAQRDAFAYVNVARAVQIVAEGIAATVGEERARLFRSVVEKLGLDAVRAASVADTVEEQGFRTRVCVQASAPRRGIYDLLDPAPINEEMLRICPATSRFLFSIKLRPEKLLPLVRDVLRVAAAGDAARLDAGLEGLRARSGIDIERDVIAGLGIEWSLFSMPSNVLLPGGLSGLTGLTFVAMVHDPEAFAKAYDVLVKLGAVWAATAGYPLRERLAADGTVIRYVGAPMGLTPAVALGAHHLVIAPSADIVEAVLRAIGGDRDAALIDTPEYRTSLGRTEVAPGHAVFYQAPVLSEDLAPPLSMAPLAATRLYRLANDRTVPRVLRDVIRAIDLNKVPSADTIARHAIATIVVGWSDADGVGVTLWGPVGISAAAGALAGAALAASAPDVLRARDRLGQGRCTERLKEVVRALRAYAEEHDGAFPPRLADLVPQYVADASLLACPSSGMPYSYISGMLTSDSETMIVAFETEAHHGAGGNVATVNGTVVWRGNAKWVDLQVKRQVQRLNESGRRVTVTDVPVGETPPKTVEEFF